MTKGTRVQAHPATDAWIMGDRYGTVIKLNRDCTIRVRMDRSNRVLNFHPRDLIVVK